MPNREEIASCENKITQILDQINAAEIKVSELQTMRGEDHTAEIKMNRRIVENDYREIRKLEERIAREKAKESNVPPG